MVFRRQCLLTANLLQQHHDVKLYDAQRVGRALFNKIFRAVDPIGTGPYFASTLYPATDLEDRARSHRQVNKNILVKTIENMLSVDGMDDLLVDKNLFTYVNADGQVGRHGGTMLYLVYERLDPTTTVGMDVHLKKLEKYKMGDHNNDVASMLRFMEEHCQILRHNGKELSNYRRLLLDALLTGPNATFNAFIQRMVDDVESGTESNRRIQPHVVVAVTRAKFNNMKINGDWNKVDPRDAQILALITQVKELKASKIAALATGSTNNDDVFKTDDGIVLSKGCIPGTKIAM